MNSTELILALCILAHAVAGRIPVTRTISVLAAVIYAFALVLVLVLLYQRVHL